MAHGHSRSAEARADRRPSREAARNPPTPAAGRSRGKGGRTVIEPTRDTKIITADLRVVMAGGGCLDGERPVGTVQGGEDPSANRSFDKRAEFSRSGSQFGRDTIRRPFPAGGRQSAPPMLCRPRTIRIEGKPLDVRVECPGMVLDDQARNSAQGTSWARRKGHGKVDDIVRACAGDRTDPGTVIIGARLARGYAGTAQRMSDGPAPYAPNVSSSGPSRSRIASVVPTELR